MYVEGAIRNKSEIWTMGKLEVFPGDGVHDCGGNDHAASTLR